MRFKSYLQLIKRDQAGDGGDGGGSGNQTVTPEVQAMIDAAVNNAVGGLKSKNSELLGKLKESSEKLKEFDGIDPGAVRNILQRFSDDEEAKLIAGGKIDEVLNKRTERMKAGFDKELKAAADKVAAAEARAQKFTARVLENHIRAEAEAAGLHRSAIDDAIFRAQTAFGIDDDGNVAAKDGMFGKDGKPLTLKEWYGDMRDKAPHWFPAQSGGGSQGGGSNAGGKSMSRAAFEQLAPVEQASYIKSGGKVT